MMVVADSRTFTEFYDVGEKEVSISKIQKFLSCHRYMKMTRPIPLAGNRPWPN